MKHSEGSLGWVFVQENGRWRAPVTYIRDLHRDKDLQNPICLIA